jgi:hypothetical protein
VSTGQTSLCTRRLLAKKARSKVAAPHHPVEVALYPLVVNRDDIVQRTRCIVCHGGSLLLTWLRLATSSSTRFGAATPTQLRERFGTSSKS